MNLSRIAGAQPRSCFALSLGLAFALGGCASLTEPGGGAPPPAPDEAPQATAEVVATAAPTPRPPAPEPMVGASHVLIAYKGSERAAPTITRSKEEAKKLATEVMNKAKKGQDFVALAKQYSDEPGAKQRAGNLGKFQKAQMVKPFADAAFALQPGQISDVVETKFGFHVIKRTE